MKKDIIFMIKKLEIFHFLKYFYGKIPYPLRQNRVFRDTYRFIMETQNWDDDRLEELQAFELRRLIIHAYKYVPYYRKLFDRLKIKPADIKDLKDLEIIPLLSKAEVRKHKREFISTIHKKKLTPALTGGSTGSPLHFWYEKGVTMPRHLAFVWRMWNRYGYTWKDKGVIFKGKYELGESIKYNPLDKNLYFFNPEFTEDKVKKYLYIIKNYKPVIIRGYPSLLFLLSNFINKMGIKVVLPSLKFIFTSSEKLYDFQREEIERAFHTKVYDHYGHNERLAFISQCPDSNYYRVEREYGIVEFIGDENGEAKEIVATGFNNYAFPLIRYRTEDWVFTEEDTSSSLPLVKEIIGRSGDFILTPSGKYISPTLISFSLRYVKNFKNIQIVQKDIDLIVIRLVPDENFDRRDLSLLVKELKNRIEENIHVETQILDTLPSPENYKWRFIKSEILDGKLQLK